MKKNVKIKTDYIKLDQLLKYASIVQTGGQAKLLIKNGQIKVNNEVVFQRGRKIHKGDKIIIDDEDLIIVE